MPQLVTAAVDEMWSAANLAFGLCPTLTGGAIEAIELNGSDALKQTYLPKMVAGEWTGTMNLTEPQAGSDLAAVRTKAVRQADGSYKLYGSKIFITYGEHDYTGNIVHLVLARTPDAPPGTRGISLFVVPKFLVQADGAPGERNDVRCVSLEHKLGIHASPTAVLAFGDRGGATGYVVGEENRGLEYMFVMMNLARFGVGMQGVGIAEPAYQRAATYARKGIDALEEAGRFVVTRFGVEPRAVLAGAVPLLELAGIVCSGAQLARAAVVAARKLAAGEGDADFLRAKIATARHFADHCLTHAPALGETVTAGAIGVLALADELI